MKRIWCASGAQGLFGEGYSYHKALKLIGLGPNFSSTTLVTKTLTLLPTEGNMGFYLIKPKCIIVKPYKGVVLNAVGLTNPGIEAALKQNKLQSLEEFFWISFSLRGKQPETRLREVRVLSEFLSREKFSSQFGIQINISCPNVKKRPVDIKEVHNWSNVLKVPLNFKINVLTPVEYAQDLSQFGSICVGNTIPWGKLHEKIDWAKLFGSHKSPLHEYGGGGLSGSPLLPLVCDWIKNFRKIDSTTYINGCGGILSREDALRVLDSGANSISLGSIAMLRPWRMSSIIKEIAPKK